MEVTKNDRVGSIVAKDYRTSDVFVKYKIDFCCGGGITLEEACRKNSLDAQEVVDALAAKLKSAGENTDYLEMSSDELIEFILKHHHAYVEENIPYLRFYVEKIANVHGSRHPELLELKNILMDALEKLELHMKKEELMLFPYIKQIQNAINQDESVLKPAFETVDNPIAVMNEEHDFEGEAFRKMRDLTNDFRPPEDACTTYQIAFKKLAEFEADLHKHVHLENNILFPKAQLLESQIRFN